MKEEGQQASLSELPVTQRPACLGHSFAPATLGPKVSVALVHRAQGWTLVHIVFMQQEESWNRGKHENFGVTIAAQPGEAQCFGVSPLAGPHVLRCTQIQGHTRLQVVTGACGASHSCWCLLARGPVCLAGSGAFQAGQMFYDLYPWLPVESPIASC